MISAITPACRLAAPNTFSVGSPLTTSRKWPASRCRTLQLRCGPVPGGRAHQRHEHRDQRQREHARSRRRSSRWRRARSRPPAARSPRAGPGGDTARSSRPVRRSRVSPRSSARPCAPRRSAPAPARPLVATEPRAAVSLPAPRHGRQPSSAPHATAARASTTTSSATIGPRSCDSPLPVNAWATTLASSQACEIASSSGDRAEPDRGGDERAGGVGVAQQPWVDGAPPRPLAPRPFLPHGRSPPRRAGAHIMRIG